MPDLMLWAFRLVFAVVFVAIVVLGTREVHGSLRDGRAGLRGWRDAKRSKNPVWFWFYVSMQVAISGFFSLAELGSLLSLFSEDR